MRYAHLALLTGLTISLITGSLSSTASAQDAKDLVDRVQKALQEKDAKITALEKAVKDKDREIAELKQKLEQIAAKAKPEEKPAPKAEPGKAPVLGVAHDAPAEEVRGKLGLKEGVGAQVTEIYPQSPAAKGGIQVGDVILSFGGKDVSSGNFRELVRARSPGDKVDVVVQRGADRKTINVELVDRDKFLAATSPEQPKTEEPKKEQPKAEPKPEPVVLGLLIEETDNGLVVQNVEAGKTGAAAKMKEGDIVVSVNGKAVKKLDELTDILEKTKVGQELTLEYKRKDESAKATVLAAAEKGEAKLVKIDQKSEAKPAEPKKEAAKAPAVLGISLDTDSLKIIEVRDGGPAAVAGIKKDDVIKELGGQKLKTVDDLKAALRARSAGEEVKIVLQRGNEEKVLEKVKLGGESTPATAEAPKAEPKPAPKPEEPKPAPAPQKPRGVLGITAQETDDLKLVISVVNAGSPAEKAGLKKDDLILKVNGTDLKRGFDDLEKILKDALAGDVLRLVIKRGEETKEISVQLVAANAAPADEGDTSASLTPDESGAARVYVGVALLEEGDGSADASRRITVDEVIAGGPAARAGLLPGDEIQTVDQQPLRTLEDFGDALGKRAPGETLHLRVLRSGRAVEAGLTVQAAAVEGDQGGSR